MAPRILPQPWSRVPPPDAVRPPLSCGRDRFLPMVSSKRGLALRADCVRLGSRCGTGGLSTKSNPHDTLDISGRLRRRAFCEGTDGTDDQVTCRRDQSFHGRWPCVSNLPSFLVGTAGALRPLVAGRGSGDLRAGVSAGDSETSSVASGTHALVGLNGGAQTAVDGSARRIRRHLFGLLDDGDAGTQLDARYPHEPPARGPLLRRGAGTKTPPVFKVLLLPPGFRGPDDLRLRVWGPAGRANGVSAVFRPDGFARVCRGSGVRHCPRTRRGRCHSRRFGAVPALDRQRIEERYGYGVFPTGRAALLFAGPSIAGLALATAGRVFLLQQASGSSTWRFSELRHWACSISTRSGTGLGDFGKA